MSRSIATPPVDLRRSRRNSTHLKVERIEPHRSAASSAEAAESVEVGTCLEAFRPDLFRLVAWHFVINRSYAHALATKMAFDTSSLSCRVAYINDVIPCGFIIYCRSDDRYGHGGRTISRTSTSSTRRMHALQMPTSNVKIPIESERKMYLTAIVMFAHLLTFTRYLESKYTRTWSRPLERANGKSKYTDRTPVHDFLCIGSGSVCPVTVYDVFAVKFAWPVFTLTFRMGQGQM